MSFNHRLVNFIAAYAGIIQGLGWTVLSLVCILYYNNVFTTNKSNDTPYWYLILIDNDTIFYFMVVYLVVSVFWITHSSLLLWGTITKTPKISVYKILWIINTWAVNLTDYIFFRMLCVERNTNVPVIILGTRGGVGLLFNLIMVIVMIYSEWKVNSFPRQPINAYSSSQPSLWNATPPQYTNYGYVQNEPQFNNGSLSGPWLEPQNSFNTFPSQDNPPESFKSYSPKGRTPKLYRQNAPRTVPLAILPPTIPAIPAPDYSPPGSPQAMRIKPALKSNSNYVM